MSPGVPADVPEAARAASPELVWREGLRLAISLAPGIQGFMKFSAKSVVERNRFGYRSERPVYGRDSALAGQGHCRTDPKHVKCAILAD